MFNNKSKKYKVTVSTPMMMILSLFDDQDSQDPKLSLDSILKSIDLPREIVLSAVYSLSCEPIPKCSGGSGNLLQKNPASVELSPDDIFTVNTSFNSLLRTIRVPSKKYSPK